MNGMGRPCPILLIERNTMKDEPTALTCLKLESGEPMPVVVLPTSTANENGHICSAGVLMMGNHSWGHCAIRSSPRRNQRTSIIR